MIKYELFEVGGKIRDEILGLQSKDIDYSVVIDRKEQDPLTVFYLFEETLKKEGYDVFQTTPDCFTIRAKFPEDHIHSGVADFVLAREELEYLPNSRTPRVRLGSLEDDLRRRDFTVNAIAKDSEGNYIDPFNGRRDIKDMVLRTPIDTAVSFNDDPLRILRAMRFTITKGFEWSNEIWSTLNIFDADKMAVVSVERIREELFKCFKHDTIHTLSWLRILSGRNYPLYRALLPDNLWLEPTLKQ